MPKSRKRRKLSERLAASTFDRRTRRGKNSSEHNDKSAAGTVTVRSSGRNSVLRFLLIFGILLAVFYLFIAFVPFYSKRFVPSYHHFIAEVSGYLLTILGQDITVMDASISSPRFSVNIIRGCDAVEPIALYVCAVLAFPLSFMKKLPGMIAGTLVLSLLNFIRIVSLFLIGVYSPKIFNLTHIDLWQALFIFFAVLLWILWLLWATRSQVVTRLASS